MAKVYNQSVPSALFDDYTKTLITERFTGFTYYLAGYYGRYIGLVQKRINFRLPTRQGFSRKKVSKPEYRVRRGFQFAIYGFQFQISDYDYSGGLVGPRNKTWWYDQAPGNKGLYFNDFMSQTLPSTQKAFLPSWCIMPEIYVSDTQNDRIQKIDGNTLTFIDKALSVGGGVDQCSNPLELVAKGSRLYISDADNARVVILEKNGLSWIDTIESADISPQSFLRVNAVRVGQNQIFVVDILQDRIFCIGLVEKNVIWYANTAVESDSFTPQPNSIAIDQDYYYVTDEANNKVKKIYRDDRLSRAAIGGAGSGDFQFNLCRGVDIDADYIYVADYGNSRIVKMTKDLYTWVLTAGPGQDVEVDFDGCSSVFVFGDYLLVADRNNDRLVKLDRSTLNKVGEFGTTGTGDGQFDKPEAVGADQTNAFNDDPV